MGTVAEQERGAAGPPAGRGGDAPSLTPAELAELMGAFNEMTARLQGTHETLHAEVVRLKNELHRANEELQRSKRLAALGGMAAGIAHEVRNPLGSIQLYAGHLEQDLADRPAERGIAVKIGAAVRRLDEIVNDVLTFGREIKARRTAADAHELLSRALETCLPEGGPARGGVSVRRRDLERAGNGAVAAGASRAGAVVLECDSGLVCQALVNLIRNALDAMAEAPGGGGAPPHVLTLDARQRDGADADGPGVGGRGDAVVVISVGDTGPGITPDVLDRMFNPFFTTRPTGTGLGLSIVHGIVEAHGGAVVVRNNGGRGDEIGAGGGRGAMVELHLPSPPPAAADRGDDATFAGQQHHR